MHGFTWLFLLALAASVSLRLWLARRHIAHVSTHRAQVPESFAGKVSPEEHRKAADYTVTNTRIGILALLYDSALLLGWTLGGGLAWLDTVVRGAGQGAVVTGTAVILGYMVLATVLDLPFSLWHTFVVEQRFGFNRSSPALFVTDLLKQALLLAVLGTPLVALALWIMLAAGSLWWLYVWLVWTLFTLLMYWAYPAFIAPLFNRFTPLADTSLQSRIQALMDKCGFRSNGIFVMDGSKRSGHGNAYFTGFGNNKRIVFFDTLLESLEPVEIEAVLAHELGHFRLHHIRKRLLTGMLMSLAALALLGWLSGQDWFYQGLGIPTPSPWMALLLFLLVLPVFTFILQPLLSRLSRRHEFEADDYAVRQSSGADLAQALVKMYRENASTLTPDPLYSAWHDSHPPAPVRIAHIYATMNA
jgi:STE24 endopeptidase